jgi:hypothetical protein
MGTEGKDPGCVWVVLSNQGLETKLLSFLQCPAVGRVVYDLVHEEEVRAARLDRWIPSETEYWAVPCHRI